MLTSSALCPADTLRIGTLTIQRRRAQAMRPYLCLAVWSPRLKDFEYFEFPDPPVKLDVVVEIGPGPDDASTGRSFAGLDPTRSQDHRRMIAGFAAKLRRWRVEQKFRSELAEHRRIDRVHRREWPDMAPVSWSA